MVKETDAKSGITYTQAILDTMDHHWLKYIDHFYVGASFTTEANQYGETLEAEVFNSSNSVIKNKAQEVEVSHTHLTYEEFLQDEKLNIWQQVDENVIEGFVQAWARNCDLDHWHVQKVKKYLAANNLDNNLTDNFKNKLGI